MNQLETIVKNKELQECLARIENKLGWGESTRWSSYDFEKLSESICQVTGMKLSANTLKRIWGKLNYESDPSTTTLNILAQFLGFDDWRNFTARKKNKKRLSNSIHLKKYALVGIPALIFLPLFYILLSGSSFLENRPDPSNYSFSSRKIAKGIPNSVVFKYNAPNMEQADKLEIQQNWDDSKRHSISNFDSIATSIYYNPGYFNAKLVVNDIVVKEHGLLIPSNGWLGILEGKDSPIYVRQDDIMRNGGIEISDSILNERLSTQRDDQPPVKLYYIENFQGLYLDDFTLDMVVGKIGKGKSKVCQTSTLTVYCEGQVIIVPRAPKGCISEINLRILDRSISGKTNDLSNFGVDKDEDTSIRLSSSNGYLSIFINDLLAYSVKLEKNKHRSISGIRYNSHGTVSIKNIVLKNTEKVFLSKLSSEFGNNLD